MPPHPFNSIQQEAERRHSDVSNRVCMRGTERAIRILANQRLLDSSLTVTHYALCVRSMCHCGLKTSRRALLTHIVVLNDCVGNHSWDVIIGLVVANDFYLVSIVPVRGSNASTDVQRRSLTRRN